MAENEIQRQRNEHLNDTSGPAKEDAAPKDAPKAPAKSDKPATPPQDTKH
jgi:hypothetical protein